MPCMHQPTSHVFGTRLMAEAGHTHSFLAKNGSHMTPLMFVRHMGIPNRPTLHAEVLMSRPIEDKELLHRCQPMSCIEWSPVEQDR